MVTPDCPDMCSGEWEWWCRNQCRDMHCTWPTDYVKDEYITIQRRTKGALDNYAQWQISFGSTRFYSTDEDEDSRGNDNTPPVYSGEGSHWGHNYLSSVDRSLQKAEIYEGHCALVTANPIGPDVGDWETLLWGLLISYSRA
jgi:hypothetical protein